MEKLYYEDYWDFINEVIDKLDFLRQLDKYNDIAIVAKYEEARQIIKELICADFNIRSIEIHEPEWEGYTSEYIISVTNIDEDYEIYCEPMLREKDYLHDDSTLIYIMSNCSSKVTKYCNGSILYEVAIDDDDEWDCDECVCDCCEECEKECISEKDSFTVTVNPTGTYFVNGKPVSQEVFEKCEKEFNDMYEKHMLAMDEMIDEMNEWRRLFNW